MGAIHYYFGQFPSDSSSEKLAINTIDPQKYNGRIQKVKTRHRTAT